MHHLLCSLIVFLSCLPIQFLVSAKSHGFAIELIHRDSRLSPFYNASATLEELSSNDAARSVGRLSHFRQSLTDESKIQSVVIPNGADYLMKLSIGSPPIESFAIADTGSDLVWIQCQPCVQCYSQDSPIFDPIKSSSYMDLPCGSGPCQALEKYNCGTNNECEYTYGYGDLSTTIGNLATDTFTFDSTDGQAAAFPNSVFGCGHDNSGTFTCRGTGLVRLGGGPLSLISQLSSEIDNKFSYCLLPRTSNSNSKLRFGNDASLSGGNGVVSTPLLSTDSDTFYYLNLESVTVGNKKIINNNMDAGEGNIVIDSGTTLNLLEQNFYYGLEAAVKEVVGLDYVEMGTYKLCYDSNSFGNLPEMTMVFHFTGADVVLKTINIFRNRGNGFTCLAMTPVNGVNIYGNWAQINFQVEYDLANKQVSFAPADCTQF